jgi:hypothetical protein
LWLSGKIMRKYLKIKKITARPGQSLKKNVSYLTVEKNFLTARVKVMTTISGEFRQFSAEKIAIFISKTMI